MISDLQNMGQVHTRIKNINKYKVRQSGGTFDPTAANHATALPIQHPGASRKDK